MKPLFLLIVVFAFTALAADKNAAPATMTQAQGQAILDELRQIHALLEKLQPPKAVAPAVAAPPAPPSRITMKLDPSLDHIGREDAPLTIVEFSDYECSFCRQFHVTVYRDLRKNYIETGKLRFISLDLPLEMHANAKAAALAAHCAGEQGHYWPMREALIGNGSRLSPEMILEIARGLYINLPEFQGCIDSRKYMPVIERAMQQASSLTITGTPTFVIGETTKEGIDGAVFVGALPYETFETELKKIAAAQ